MNIDIHLKNNIPAREITVNDVIDELHRITHLDSFFRRINDNSFGIYSCANNQCHSKIIGLLLVLNGHSTLCYNYYTTINSSGYGFAVIRNNGGSWQPLYDVLRKFPCITDIKINLK